MPPALYEGRAADGQSKSVNNRDTCVQISVVVDTSEIFGVGLHDPISGAVGPGFSKDLGISNPPKICPFLPALRRTRAFARPQLDHGLEYFRAVAAPQSLFAGAIRMRHQAQDIAF